MQTKKLEMACPVCGSGDIVYSCTPSCCFNHLCAACTTTFEPVTTLAGGTVPGVEAPEPLPDSSDPTVECAKCGSTAVYMMEGGGLVCGECGSALRLELTEVAAG